MQSKLRDFDEQARRDQRLLATVGSALLGGVLALLAALLIRHLVGGSLLLVGVASAAGVLLCAALGARYGSEMVGILARAVGRLAARVTQDW